MVNAVFLNGLSLEANNVSHESRWFLLVPEH